MKSWFGPLVLGASGCAVLLSLGVWQLQRLEWKENLIASMEEQMQAEPIGFDDLTTLDGDVSGIAFAGEGRILADHTDILTGDKELGAGYRRLYVFEGDDHRIAVEAGFLSEAQKNDETIKPDDARVEIQGHLYTPFDGKGSYDAGRDIWIGYNLAEMSALLDVEPYILVASTSPVEGVKATPFTINLPNNHLQYAITWFSLAIVWVMMSLYWGFRRAKEN